jgi:hypothetical protein
VIVAADHMGHAHVVIVDHHRQHVGRRAVAAQQDEIVQLGILTVTRPWTRSSITVSPSRGALMRTTKGRSPAAVGGIGIAPFAVDAERCGVRACAASRGARPVLPGVR